MGTVREIGRHGRIPSPAVTVGLIAHDAKKEDLARFMHAHAAIVPRFRFLAPEDTARALEGLRLKIEVLAPDTLGGDLQVAAAVVEGRVDAVIFLHDPVASLPAEPNLGNVVKVCDLAPIPLATNLAAAELVIHRLATVLEDSTGEPTVDSDGFERVLVLANRWPGEDDPAATH